MATCDRCVADAKIIARLPGGGELGFCGHHFREHRPALTQVARITFVDDGWFSDDATWARQPETVVAR